MSEGLEGPPVVMVVDDDSLVLAVILRFLSGERFVVRPFYRAEAAIAMLETLRPRVVVSDYNLSPAGCNGIDVLTAVATRVPSAGRILMSGSPAAPSTTESRPLVVDAFLRKPFTGAELRGLVEACASLRREEGIARKQEANHEQS